MRTLVFISRLTRSFDKRAFGGTLWMESREGESLHGRTTMTFGNLTLEGRVPCCILLIGKRKRQDYHLPKRVSVNTNPSTYPFQTALRLSKC